MARGLFISLEGGEGAGKSTLSSALRRHFRSFGYSVDLTREPGGTPDAEQIRNLLVAGDTGRWSAIEEMLLLFAARANHLRQRIQPNLEKGCWVICDRFTDSTFAYQGAGGSDRQDIARIHALNQLALNNFTPDITLILDIDPQIGLSRTRFRDEFPSRFEEFPFEFHEKIRSAFLAIAQDNPNRCFVLDASRPQHEVFAAALHVISNKFPALQYHQTK